ncbi:hypothetical protein QAD02_005794 [Eretmocerus hayati]|uniref:Uncharacterized protein n=1 Tax=Eretmocerus hayati TaxID=131215 RepID=A0ACC2NWE8_9HYME|nr:hypothetical protein QAD02_005794 [Eretmocerus hayati]
MPRGGGGDHNRARDKGRGDHPRGERTTNGQGAGDSAEKSDERINNRGRRNYNQYSKRRNNTRGGGGYGNNRHYGGRGDGRFYSKRPRFDVGERLKEADVGITEYVGDHEGFTGTIKERYTDFVVHEIALDGSIAKLTQRDIPDDPEDLEDIEDLKKKVPEDIWEKLEKITEDVSSIEIDVTDIDKDQRKCIHQIVKKLTSVYSETKDIDNRKVIVFSKEYYHKFGNRSQESRSDWSSRGGDYCHFILHKVNLDTMDALNQLSRMLHVKPAYFAYAGTKDRRAKTTQWISVRKMNPARILKAAKSVRSVHVGNFKFEKQPLELGKLHGNRFTIALRNVSAPDEHIEKAISNLRDHGFINYYGLQRFGAIASIPTYEIGKALLQGDWAKAIDLILKPREGEQDPCLAEAREIYATTQDSRAAYRKIGRTDRIEAKLLYGINIHGPKNLQGALDLVPRNICLMYIHAYQSHVWNNIVSKRLKEYGFKPVVGDLVYEDPESIEAEHVHDDPQPDEDGKTDLPENMNDENVDATDSAPLDGTKNDGSAGEGNIGSDSKEQVDATNKEDVKVEDDKSSKKGDYERPVPKVKVLTEADLPNYTLADVVLPLPGWKVTYPPYAKSWYDESLQKDGLTTELKQKNKKYTLGGSYRKVLEIPQNLTWKIIRYNNKIEDLILSDMDEMMEKKPIEDNPEGQFKALIVQMSLKSSTYATMALRELLRCDTSTQTLAAQSAAFEEAHEKSEKDQAVGEGQENVHQNDHASTENDTSQTTEDEANEKKINVSAVSSSMEDSASESVKHPSGDATEKHEVDTINDSGIEAGTVANSA